MRVNVLGTSGSGKSTFAKRIAENMGVPYVEMDALFWKPNWRETSDTEFILKIEDSISGDGWVLDGNYTRTIPTKWKRVQMVVYLDLPFWTVAYRLIKRSLVRTLTHQELWSGCRETIWKTFLSRDSVLLWALKMFQTNRERFEEYSRDSDFSHITFVRLRSREAVENFAQGIRNEHCEPE